MATLDKYRRKAVAAGGVARMAEEDRRAYGRAVLADIRAKLAPRNPGARPCPCASGTWHNDGERILDAVNRQNAARIQKSVEADRKARTPLKWKQLYEAAMEAKHNPMKEAAE